MSVDKSDKANSHRRRPPSTLKIWGSTRFMPKAVVLNTKPSFRAQLSRKHKNSKFHQNVSLTILHPIPMQQLVAAKLRFPLLYHHENFTTNQRDCTWLISTFIKFITEPFSRKSSKRVFHPHLRHQPAFPHDSPFDDAHLIEETRIGDFMRLHRQIEPISDSHDCCLNQL